MDCFSESRELLAANRWPIKRGAGTTTVTYETTTINPASALTGSLTIGGLPYSVTQAAAVVSPVALSPSGNWIAQTSNSFTIPFYAYFNRSSTPSNSSVQLGQSF